MVKCWKLSLGGQEQNKYACHNYFYLTTVLDFLASTVKARKKEQELEIKTPKILLFINGTIAYIRKSKVSTSILVHLTGTQSKLSGW